MLVGGGGATGVFSFQVPQGNPAEVDAAASACSTWAAALTGRAGAVRNGAATAMAGWSGSAESNFASFASRVEHVYETLGTTVTSAGKTLSTFAHELETAQRITKQALQECETYSQQASSARAEAAQHAQTAQDLTSRAATAIHPAQQAEISRQLSAAQDAQASAEQAASSAQGQLEAAQQRGTQAYTAYEQQAQAAATALQGLSGQIEKVMPMPAGGGAPGLAGAPDKSQFDWPTLGGVIGSQWLDPVIGFGEGVADRYRNSPLVLARTEEATNALQDIAGKVGNDGELFTWTGSLWVPKGSSGDPLTGQILERSAGKDFLQPGQGGFVADGTSLEAAAPQWASRLGKGLGYGGVALTFYATGTEQWAYDSEHHPTWSTTQKVLDTAQTTAVVGGAEAGGAWVGAEQGAEVGAGIGEMIDPLGGGVIGGVIGGVAGGFIGGHYGKDIGHAAETVGKGIVGGAEDVGQGIAHTASSVWNSIF